MKSMTGIMILGALTFFACMASADEVTFNVSESLIDPNGADGSINPLVYTDPTLFVSGTISFDPLAAMVASHNPGGIESFGTFTYDLHFSWLGGGIEYSGGGYVSCPDDSWLFPGATTCYMGSSASPLPDGDAWGLQTNIFDANQLTPGTSIYLCSARTTVYPDGELGLGSGICGGTSGAVIQGHTGVVYGLRLDEGGGTSGTFEVVPTPEPPTIVLMLLAGAIFIVWMGRKLVTVSNFES
jgi:hypothetical protein